MALTHPSRAIYPKSRIDNIIEILYDGTLPGNKEFSIAKILLKNGDVVLGIRYDRSYWSVNPDNAYPTVRGGNPSWFILPEGFKEVFCSIL